MFTFIIEDVYLEKAISELITRFNIEQESIHTLVRLREEANLSQSELADLSGVHYVTLRRIESGVQDNLQSKTIVKLTRICKNVIEKKKHSIPTS